MNFDTLLPWFNPAVAMISVIYTWVATRDKDNSQHIKAVEEALSRKLVEHAAQLTEHQLRLEHLLTVQQHLPTHKDVADLRTEMSALKERQNATVQAVDVMCRSVDSLREYLMNKKD